MKSVIENLRKCFISSTESSYNKPRAKFRSSFSIFQFPSVDYPGDVISYPNEHLSVSTSKKVNSLPSSYTEVRKFLLPSSSFKFVAAPILVIPDLNQSIYDQGVNDEYEWLENAYHNSTSDWVGWAKHHAG